MHDYCHSPLNDDMLRGKELPRCWTDHGCEPIRFSGEQQSKIQKTGLGAGRFRPPRWNGSFPRSVRAFPELKN